jgi:hypothetical protein
MVLKLGKSVTSLIVLIFIAWLLIILGSVIIFKLIVPIPNITQEREGILITAIIKALLSTMLVITWVLLFIKLRDIIFSKIK